MISSKEWSIYSLWQSSEYVSPLSKCLTNDVYKRLWLYKCGIKYWSTPIVDTVSQVVYRYLRNIEYHNYKNK